MRKLILCLFIVVLFSACDNTSKFEKEDNTANASGDRIRIYCTKNGREYQTTMEYSARGRRLILMAVYERDGSYRRVYRNVVKAGAGTLTWKSLKFRFKNLEKACVAMHILDGKKRTISSDCDYF